MESGGVSKIQGSVSCSIGEGGVSILTGILDGPKGVAGSFLCAVFLGCTSDIVGEWFGVGAFGVVVAVPAGFAFVSLFICFAKP